MGLFSDLVHKVEGVLGSDVLPTDMPHDTREVEALAKAGEKLAVEVDPALSPFFDAIAGAGSAVERALTELGTHVGELKQHLAKNPPAVTTPVDVAPPVEEPEPVEEPTEPVEPPAPPDTTEGTPPMQEPPAEAPAEASAEAAPAA